MSDQRLRRGRLVVNRGMRDRRDGENDAMDVRDAEESEIDQLARLWHEGWHESHASIVPAELTRIRTLESFRDRLQAALPNIRVVGPSLDPVGFSIVKGAEL